MALPGGMPEGTFPSSIPCPEQLHLKKLSVTGFHLAAFLGQQHPVALRADVFVASCFDPSDERSLPSGLWK